MIKAKRLLNEMFVGGGFVGRRAFAVREATPVNQAQKELDTATSLVRREPGAKKPGGDLARVQKDLDGSRSVAKREATIDVPDKEVPPLKKVVKKAVTAKELPSSANSYFKDVQSDPANNPASSKDPKEPEDDDGWEAAAKAAKAKLPPDAQARFDQWHAGPYGQKAAGKAAKAAKAAKDKPIPPEDSPGPHSSLYGKKPTEIPNDLPAPRSAAFKVHHPDDYEPSAIDATPDDKSPFPFDSFRGSDDEEDAEQGSLGGVVGPGLYKPGDQPSKQGSLSKFFTKDVEPKGKVDPKKTQTNKTLGVKEPKKQSALSRIFKGRRDDDI